MVIQKDGCPHSSVIVLSHSSLKLVTEQKPRVTELAEVTHHVRKPRE